MAFLLKRQDGQEIAKKKNRYCPIQNGTYGQPMHVGSYLRSEMHVKEFIS
jgi:hypothetical protein